MNILEKLFGNQARVRLMRIFYLNSDKVITPKEVKKMAKVTSRAVSKETKLLLSLGFLGKRVRLDEVKKKNKKPKIKKVLGFSISDTFPLFSALRALVVGVSPVARENIFNFFKKYKKIKLVSIAGVFLDSASSSLVDLFIVGNVTKKGLLEKFIKRIEPDVGREINWTILSLSEFNDRVAMHDKFLRDFFESPNECLINKIEGIQF